LAACKTIADLVPPCAADLLADDGDDVEPGLAVLVL